MIRSSFILALLGWGIGFYSPPIFLHAVMTRTGWPLAWVSAAVTLHFLVGAVMVANLPGIYRRFGLAHSTCGATITLCAGMFGWALASQPWHLALAACLTGGSWVFLGAAAINTIISPWYAKQRPMALAKVYNGGSIGGVIFSPLWVALIERYGFLIASGVVSLILLCLALPIGLRVLPQTPESRGEYADGDIPESATIAATTAESPVPSATAGVSHIHVSRADASQIDVSQTNTPPAVFSLWRDRRFLTLTGAMALALFAQIGLLTQLYGLLVPILGAKNAGWTMSLVTACSVAGRHVVAKLLGPNADRRRVAATSYGIQTIGTLALLLVGADSLPLALLAIVLFGLGIGNATSLPPLIAQQEFAKDLVPKVVARSVALSQGLYALAPAAFAALLIPIPGVQLALGQGTTQYFAAVLAIQCCAIVLMLLGLSSRRNVAQ